jgi:hypothetical protein
MIRRAPKLTAESEPERIWRLRVAPGDVREPLNQLHIRALLESGVASAESAIARIGEDTWQRLSKHPLWTEVAPPATPVPTAKPLPVDPGVIPMAVHEATPKMQAIWQEKREEAQAEALGRAALEEHGQFLQGVGYACGVASLICVGDIILFTCNLATAFVFLVGLVRLTALALVWRAMR